MGNHEERPAELTRPFCSVAGAADEARLDDHDDVRKCDEAGISGEERRSSGRNVVRDQRNIGSALADDSPKERDVAVGKGSIEAGGRDDRGRAASAQGSDVRGGVDAFGPA